jgi:signal transduction histidine kinase
VFQPIFATNVRMRVFCLIILFFVTSFSYGQSESFDFSKLLKFETNNEVNLKRPPHNDSIGNYLGNLLILARNSNILLSDLDVLIQESDKVIHETEGLEKYDYLIHIIEAIKLKNEGRNDLFQETIFKIKEKLVKEGRQNDIIRVNVEVAHYLGEVGKSDEGNNYLYENEALDVQYELEKLPGYNPLELIISSNSFGLFFEKNGQLDSAMKYYRIGLNRALVVNSRAWIGIISGNLGSLYVKTGNLIEAEKYLLTDLEVSYHDGEINSAVLATLSLIDLKLQARKLNEAKDLLTKLRKMESLLAKDDYNFEGIYYVELNKRLGRYHMLNGESELADAYLNLAFDRLEKISNGNKDQVNKFVNKRYALENHVANLTTYKEKSVRTKYMLFFIGILLIGAIFIVFNQRKFNKKLTEKNTEIALQADNLSVLNQQKSMLFSIVAHDIKSPLNNLKSLLEMHNEEVIDEAEFHVYKSKINRSLNGLSNMLENILTWSRLSIQNGLKVKKIELDILPLIEELKGQTSEIFASKKLTWETQINYSGLVWGDKEFVRVILRNLINNAVKFSKEGSRIELVVENSQKEGFALLSVRDFGIGMDELQIAQLFSKTSKPSTTKGTSGETGTGLGLTICNDFAQAMGTTISIKSEINVGSTFSMELKKV